MKAFTTLVSAAALAVTLTAASVPAHAAVFASMALANDHNNFKWVQSASGTGGEFFSINSNSQTSAHATAISFKYLSAGLTGLGNMDALLTFDATSPDGNPATLGGGGTWTQIDVNTTTTPGFKIIYNGTTTTIGTHTLTHGVTNLLSGTFTDAWIQGGGGSGSINLSHGVATYTSDLQSFAGIVANSETFALDLLLPSSDSFNAGTGKSLDNFKAAGSGNFDFQTTGVPEPAAWSLMIMGFGGVGALLRSNRRRYATA